MDTTRALVEQVAEFGGRLLGEGDRHEHLRVSPLCDELLVDRTVRGVSNEVSTDRDYDHLGRRGACPKV